MSITVEWTDPAFAQLEALPAELAFEIVRRVDLLETLPEIGAVLRSRYPIPGNCRQLIVKRSHRVIYEFDGDTSTVFILAIQHCRQRLPSAADLKRAADRRRPETE